MKRMIIAACICIIPAVIAFSQKGESMFAPYVSGLKAEADGTHIIITWKSTVSLKGKALIYRHTAEINAQNLDKARLLIITDLSKGSYTDAPGDANGYYYAVLIQEPSGTIHKVFVAFRNITTAPVSIEELLPEEELATQITGISAAIEEDSIVITFKSSKPDRYVLLYRSPSPLVDEESLLKSITPITIEDHVFRYKDYVIPGIEYYYAVLDAGMLKIGKIAITVGENTLKEPVTLPVKGGTTTGEQATKRSLPLPYLEIVSDIQTGENIIQSVSAFLPEEKKLNEKTARAVEEIISRINSVAADKPMAPAILPVEKAESTGSEASILSKIITDYFSVGQYYKAENKLVDFLKIKHDDEIEARACFYLGQIYFFKGAFKDAFLCFLVTEDIYYVETQEWLDACFAKLYEIDR